MFASSRLQRGQPKLTEEEVHANIHGWLNGDEDNPWAPIYEDEGSVCSSSDGEEEDDQALDSDEDEPAVASVDAEDDPLDDNEVPAGFVYRPGPQIPKKLLTASRLVNSISES